MRLKLLIPLLLSTSFALAAPAAGEIEERGVNCNIVKEVVNYFTSYTAQASSFCSAYLQTTTTVIVATVPAFTKTVTTKTTITVTKTKYTTAANTFNKRVNKAARPTWLPNNIGGELVSSACSCYITPLPSAKTISATLTSGTAKVTQTKTATQTVTTTVPIYCGIGGCGNGNGFIECPNGSFTLAQCKAQCVAAQNTPEGTCQLFQWVNDGSGICCLYSVPFLEEYDPNGPPEICGSQLFYEVNCKV